MKINKSKEKKSIDVYYNDTCPICKREIEIYKLRSEGIEYKDSSSLEDKYNRRRFCIFLMNIIYEPIAFYLFKMHLRRKNN